MGQIFCKEGPEAKKDSALYDPSSDGGGMSIDDGGMISGDDGGVDYQNQRSLDPTNQAGNQLSQNSAMFHDSSEQGLKQQEATQTTNIMSPSPGDQLKKLREEQARLELIVQTAGRGMVAVRSTRGSTGYYDQGFAAALAQHLEQTTQFPNTLPIRLPPAITATTIDSNTTTTGTGDDDNNNAADSSADNVYARLAQPQWEGIVLGRKDGLAGCAGENPNTFMDHVAVSYLDSVVPKKERLFAGVGPMVENLL